MTLEEIKKWYNKRPFRPFVIHMGDGREVPVPHPEFMARAPNGRIVVVVSDEDTHFIDLLLVTDITMKTPEGGETSE